MTTRAYGQEMHYLGGRLRVGCWACDLVTAVETATDDDAAAEAILHKLDCPHCGELALHAFGEFGCYPSEVGEPPCQRG